MFQTLGIQNADLFESPTTPDMKVPTWIVYLAVPLRSYLMCFRFLQMCVGFVRTGELPHHDHGHVEGVEAEPLTAAGNEDKVFRMDDDLHPLVDDDDATPRGSKADKGDRA